jgi:hemolysin III
MQAVLSNPNRIQSQGEEIANSISHGAGLVGALVGTPILVMHAVRQGNAGFIVGTSVFCASMIILYLASALYHAWPRGKTKRRLRILEHCAIFILIAGTYTPLTLGILRGALGWTLFGVIWVKPLFTGMPSAGLFLLVAGGLFYTAGVAFFATDSRVPYGHLIWHLFVITGTACHYFLVLWYAA